jgi:hypothetical protein
MPTILDCSVRDPTVLMIETGLAKLPERYASLATAIDEQPDPPQR